MNFLSSHRLHITPLSPVHIGCNETYEPTSYVIDDGALYEFNADDAVAGLPKASQEQLLKIVSGKPNEEMLKQVQAFFHQHREALMAQAEHYFPTGEGVADLYSRRIGKTAQHEGRGKQVINKLEIERTSYNLLDRKPMLPGSSIKGAIRTALLDQVNDGAECERNEKNQQLQQRLFDYSMRDLHKDPMRLVSVADARWSGTDIAPGNEIRFAVNRQRKPKEGIRLQQSMAEEKGLYQILECVSSLQPRCLTTTINLQKPQVLSNQHQDKLPEAELQWRVKDIAAACNRFYQKLLRQEVEAMRKMGYLDNDWIAVMGQLLSADMLEKLKNNEAFLLRVGRHSGAESVTLEGVRNGKIRIKTGKKGSDKFRDAPQTWWLAAGDTDSKGSMMPFGWVLVEIDADESQPLPAQAELDVFNTHRKQWFEKQQQHKQQLQTRLVEEQKAEQERQQAAEEQRRIEEVEAAALAAMSEEERKLQALKKLLETDQQNNFKQAGAQTSSELASLLQEGVDWEYQYRVQLTDLAEAIYNWHGWGPKKKRPNKQQVLDELRTLRE